MFSALDLQLPEAGTVFEARTAIVALLVGTLVTLVGRHPAGAAGDEDRPRRGAARRRPGARAGCGCRPASCGRRRRCVGRPAAAVGGSAGRLARRNAMRQPGRTAVTASALMIGVMLVTAVTVVANGLRQETKGDARATASPPRT